MQFNYGYCDKPDCEYCKEIKAANPGAVAPEPAASVASLNTAVSDIERKMQVSALELEGQRADGDFALATGLGKRIDAAVSGLVHGVSVVAIADDAPAAAPDGAVYIVAAAPKAGGAFVGHANEVASKATGAWTFQAAHANETHLVESDNQMWTWAAAIGTTPAQWVKVGSVGAAEKINVEVHKATDKAAPADNDELALLDSASAPIPFGLAKLTWANLQTGVWLGVKKAMDKGQDIGSGNPVDADYNLPLVGTRFGDVWGWNLGDFKKNLFNVGAIASGNMHDDTTFQVRTPAGVMWKAPWHWIRENLITKDFYKGLYKTAPQTATLLGTNAMELVSYSTTNDEVYRFPMTEVLKHATGDIVRKYINVDNGAADAAMFDISTLPNNTPSFLEIKGFASALGGAASDAVLKITTTAGVKNVEALFSNAKRTGTWGSGGSQNDGGFNDGHFYLNINAASTSTQVKGNCVATWQIRLYKQSNGWVMLEWQGLYEGSSGGTQIFCAGNASASLSEKITNIGIGFVDADNTHAARNVLADMVLEAHP